MSRTRVRSYMRAAARSHIHLEFSRHAARVGAHTFNTRILCFYVCVEARLSFAIYIMVRLGHPIGFLIAARCI